ncbi:hypothetical protein WDW37_19305 [Bdellovibrionota bacterium FG-1]
MKTITEFAAPYLKNAAQVKADLTAAGKTAEELPAAIGEMLKLEGDKLTYLLNALDFMGNRTNDLKRILVSALNEGETAPSGAKQIGERVYAIEFYAGLQKPQAPQHERDGDRKGRKGGRHGDKRGAKPGERGGRKGPGAPGSQRTEGLPGQAPKITPKAPMTPKPQT